MIEFNNRKFFSENEVKNGKVSKSATWRKDVRKWKDERSLTVNLLKDVKGVRLVYPLMDNGKVDSVPSIMFRKMVMRMVYNDALNCVLVPDIRLKGDKIEVYKNSEDICCLNGRMPKPIWVLNEEWMDKVDGEVLGRWVEWCRMYVDACKAHNMIR